MRAPGWLTARPVAHRGLHDRARGIIENMPGAALAAIDGNFGIECDIQLTADGEAMVHHDDALGRLTEGAGALLGMTAAALKAVRFKDTPERMMSLSDLCTLVMGRVPIVIELKSHFDGNRKLVTRMAEVLGTYPGPVAGRLSRCARRCRSFPVASSPNASTAKPTGRRPRRPSGRACDISGTRSKPGRISWLIR